jgi:hypothetical protein
VLRFEPNSSRADWFTRRDEPWGELATMGPTGFESYARVAVAAAIFLLDHIVGFGQVGDDAVRAALGDAHVGRDVTQPHARVVCDAQQHPGVAGQETPARHPSDACQFLEIYC